MVKEKKRKCNDIETESDSEETNDELTGVKK